MKVRIQNKIGVWVDIPHYDEREYHYCDFYMNFADHVMCKFVSGKQVRVAAPYTIIKRHFGTDQISEKEVTE